MNEVTAHVTAPDGDDGVPRNAFAWMDLVRTLAALLVAISHMRDLMWRDAVPTDPLLVKVFYLLTGFGHIGVIVFFVLSGFWITQSVVRRIDRPTFWREYLIDRLSRLWIVLVPVLLIGGTLDWLGANSWQYANYMAISGAHSIAEPVGSRLGIAEGVGSALFLADLAVSPFGSNGPLWSLAFEFWYYIWFPALFLLVARRRFTLALAALAITGFNVELAFGFISWLTGTLLFFAIQRPARPMPGMARLLAMTTTLLLALGAMMAGRVLQISWLDPLIAAAFAFFLFWLCRANPAMPRWLRPAALFGAGSSYSLYALHFPLAMAMAGWIYAGTRNEPSVSLFVTTILMLGGITALAFGFSRLTEARTSAVRKAMRQRFVAAGTAHA